MASITLESKLNRYGKLFYDILITKLKNTNREKSHKDLFLYALVSKFPEFDGILDIINSLHDSLFFYNAFYYEIENRLIGIRYMNIFPSKENVFNYKPIFWIIIATHLIKVIKFGFGCYKEYENIKTHYKQQEKEKIIETTEPAVVSKTEECKICYDERKESSATPCGHIFCWDCILKYSHYKGECPICRSKLQAKDIVRLVNLD